LVCDFADLDVDELQANEEGKMMEIHRPRAKEGHESRLVQDHHS